MMVVLPPKGSKYWHVKYRLSSDKKGGQLAFGVYSVANRVDARTKRNKAKRL